MPKLEEEPRLAIALEDLDLISAELRARLLGPKLERVNLTGRLALDEIPVVEFNCSLIEAALVVDLMRNYCRESEVNPVRCWMADCTQSQSKGWRRVPGKIILTLQRDGKTFLNPVLFLDQGLQADGLEPESVL